MRRYQAKMNSDKRIQYWIAGEIGAGVIKNSEVIQKYRRLVRQPFKFEQIHRPAGWEAVCKIYRAV